MSNVALKRDDQARLTEEEIVTLFLIGRALRMHSQELRQRQARQGHRFDVSGSGNEFVYLMFVKYQNLANP